MSVETTVAAFTGPEADTPHLPYDAVPAPELLPAPAGSLHEAAPAAELTDEEIDRAVEAFAAEIDAELGPQEENLEEMRWHKVVLASDGGSSKAGKLE